MRLNFGAVENLPPEDNMQLLDLQKIYNDHNSANRRKRRYYNGKIRLGEVNLGIALPGTIARFEMDCYWGKKAVDVLARKSVFDGFVKESGNDAFELGEIMERNNLIVEYGKATKEQLIYGCAFGVVSGSVGAARINFYNPHNAAAKWDPATKRIKCGVCFDDTRKNESDLEWTPEHVTFHTEDAIYLLDKVRGGWVATPARNDLGRPLMVPLVWNPTQGKPFGQSRIKGPERGLMQGYVRTIANATIGLEFATTPQKYLLGITSDQYEDLINQKFRQYVGSILLGTTNPETGEKPSFGQLAQGNIEPHVQMLRILSANFAAATGLNVSETGMINGDNPTSADAISEQKKDLTDLAVELNNGNGTALKELCKLALAIEKGIIPEQLTDEEKKIMPHFKNPAMPSVSITADAAIKIASARQEFAGTDVFLEMLGFDQAEIKRIKAQEAKARGLAILREELKDADNNEGLA